MWMKDPKTGKKSVTLTFFTIAFIVGIIKIILAGLTLKGIITDVDIIKLGEFSGTDFAAMVGAAGSVYGFRKFTDKEKKPKPEMTQD